MRGQTGCTPTRLSLTPYARVIFALHLPSSQVVFSQYRKFLKMTQENAPHPPSNRFTPMPSTFKVTTTSIFLLFPLLLPDLPRPLHLRLHQPCSLLDIHMNPFCHRCPFPDPSFSNEPPDTAPPSPDPLPHSPDSSTSPTPIATFITH